MRRTCIGHQARQRQQANVQQRRHEQGAVAGDEARGHLLRQVLML